MRHRTLRLATILLGGAVLLTAAACCMHTAPRTSPAGAGSATGAAGTSGSNLASPPPATRRETPIQPAPEPPKLDVAPSEGTCAPARRTPFSLTACCNGTLACNGQCIRGAAAGEAVCACFDTPGGCKEGQVCCRFRRACTTPADCAPPE